MLNRQSRRRRHDHGAYLRVGALPSFAICGAGEGAPRLEHPLSTARDDDRHRPRRLVGVLLYSELCVLFVRKRHHDAAVHRADRGYRRRRGTPSRSRRNRSLRRAGLSHRSVVRGTTSPAWRAPRMGHRDLTPGLYRHRRHQRRAHRLVESSVVRRHARHELRTCWLRAHRLERYPVRHGRHDR